MKFSTQLAPPFKHRVNVSLAEYCTFGIGGPARYFVEVHSKEEMYEVLVFSRRAQIPLFVLGKGSNCLFDDRGFEGIIVHNRIDFLSKQEELFTVGSGYSFARLGKMTAREGWEGLEFAGGIPGSVGGAIFMNAGAGGMETAMNLIFIESLTKEGEFKKIQKQEHAFSYRSSPFQKNKEIILEATFKLQRSSQAKENQKNMINSRLQTQPYKSKSAGCAFRNPLGYSAGKLIEECGFKGKIVGGAKVSDLHANFIVNASHAKAADVKILISTIKEEVYLKKGIILEEEICFIPYCAYEFISS